MSLTQTANTDRALAPRTMAVAPTRTKPLVPPAKELPATATLIVLGRDDAGKPHASWFDDNEAILATKAAGLMGMAVLEIADDALRVASASLPHGRVFASGKAFVPFVKAATYDAISAHLPPAIRAELNEPRRKVETSLTEAVLDRSSAGKASGLKRSAAVGDIGGDSPNIDTPTIPKDWNAVAVGSLVLVSEGEQDGWYEAVVIEAHDDELFTLRWRDWPDLPTLLRHRRHLGLLHPDHAAE